MKHILVNPDEALIQNQMSQFIGLPHLHGGFLAPRFLDARYLESRVYLKDVEDIEAAVKSLGLKYSGGSYVSTTISDPEHATCIPELVDLKSEIELWVNELFSPYNLKVLQWDFTMRVLVPNGQIVKRHQDYGIGWNTKLNPPRTCFGISIPISGNVAPPFIAEIDGREVIQTEPGSCMLFGPQVWHSHPPIEGFETLYFWLVMQVMMQFTK